MVNSKSSSTDFFLWFDPSNDQWNKFLLLVSDKAMRTMRRINQFPVVTTEFAQDTLFPQLDQRVGFTASPAKATRTEKIKHNFCAGLQRAAGDITML